MILSLMLILSLEAYTFGEERQITYSEYPLERNGIDLHLDCMKIGETEKNILLIHGVTYSSHEFDIDYEDYSLVRFLAREGYTVWRLDRAMESGKRGFCPRFHVLACFNTV